MCVTHDKLTFCLLPRAGQALACYRAETMLVFIPNRMGLIMLSYSAWFNFEEKNTTLFQYLLT